MQYRQLGSAGLRVSVIGLGTNQFGGKVDQGGVNNILSSAIDAGINLIDTADTYSKGNSEITIGKALEGRRDRLLLATKVGWTVGDGPNERGASRHRILSTVEVSLKRLRTDHIDLYQIHRWDNDTPIEETLRALDDLVRAGKVRYLGASNFAAWQLARANVLAELSGWTRFVSIQNEYHMFERKQEQEILPYCAAHNVGILPFFPLAGGFLTGKYRRNQAAPAGSRGEQSPYVQKYMTAANYDKLEALEDWAKARDHTMGELAHAWLLAHPQVSCVISGATKTEHIEANARGGDWNLTPDELDEVNAILDGAATSSA